MSDVDPFEPKPRPQESAEEMIVRLLRSNKPGADQVRDTKWFFLVNNFGLPLLILGAVALGAIEVAKWLKTKADEMIETHIVIVHAAKKIGEESLAVQRENKETNKKTTDILAVMADNTRPLATINGEHLRITSEIRDDVREIHRATVGWERPRPTGTLPRVDPPATLSVPK